MTAAVFVFGVILTAVLVGSFVGLIVALGFWAASFVLGAYLTVGGWMLLTGRDGPGGMRTHHHGEHEV